MNKLVPLIALIGIATNAFSQTYNPSASALPNGTLNQTYVGQIINFTIPATTPISGSDFSGALTAANPSAAPFVGIINGLTFDMSITSTTLSVSGLPAGISSTCNVNPCTYPGGGSGFLDINGTPTVNGSYTVNIISLTNGDVDMAPLLAQLPINPGLPATFPLSNQPSVFDELGYTLVVSSSGICNPPTVLFSGLNSAYSLSDGASSLVGAPSGGTFFGAGVSGNTFDPALAGLGSHAITYAFVDNNGCIGAFSLCTSVELSVGLEPNESSNHPNELRISPNPNHGRFTLNLEDVHGVTNYTIYDCLGREVYSKSCWASGSLSEQVNLSNFSEGVYTIHIKTPNHTFSNKLVVAR